MKQYRTLLLIVTFLFIGWTFMIVESCAQVKLTQVESDTVLYRIPVAHRTIPGQPGKYFMKYMGLEPLMDSLDLKGTKIDSMTFTSDTLKLYTNDGIFKVEILSGSTGTVTSVGLGLGTSGTDANVSGSPITGSGSFTLNLPSASASNRGLLTSADHTLFSNKFTLPSLTSGSVLFSNGSTIAQDNANFFWNNSTKRLSLGTTTASRQLTTTQDISVNSSDIGLGGGNQPNNCRFGNAALRDNTTGVGNLAFGAYTMMNNTTGYYNSALGNQALFTNVSGHTNTAIGQNTLYYNTGSKNTGIGTQSLFNNIGGEENTGIGPFSLYSNVSGSRNIAIGYLAGYSETGSDKLYIDPSTTSTPLIGGNFSTNRVGINKAISSLSTTLHVGGDVTIDTRTGTGTSLTMYDATGKLCTATLGSGLTITSGTLNQDYGAFTVAATTGGSGLVGPLDGDPFLTFTAGSGMTITRSGTTGDNQTLTFASTGGTTNLSYSAKSGTDVTLESSTGADVILRDGVGTIVNRVSANVIKYDNDAPYTYMNQIAGTTALTTTDAKIALSGDAASNGDALTTNYDNTNDEIDIAVAGTYEIGFSCNCKSNTSARAVIFSIKNNVTSTLVGFVKSYYFTNTDEYCETNFEYPVSLSSGARLSLYAKTGGSTTSITDCNISMYARRVK